VFFLRIFRSHLGLDEAGRPKRPGFACGGKQVDRAIALQAVPPIAPFASNGGGGLLLFRKRTPVRIYGIGQAATLFPMIGL